MLSFRAIVTLALAGASIANAAVVSRQFLGGGISCNVARFRILGALGDTSDNIAQIQDASVQQDAQAGVDQANEGISQIAQAIIAGEAPPAEGREITEAGLTAASSALASGDASDPAVASAQGSIADAIAAGEDVVANC